MRFHTGLSEVPVADARVECAALLAAVLCMEARRMKLAFTDLFRKVRLFSLDCETIQSQTI